MTDKKSQFTSSNRVRSGVVLALEEEADRLIYESLKGVTSHSEKSDILTKWKERDRHDREVLSSSGAVDPSIRRGIFRREYNSAVPRLNSRDGHMRPTRSRETFAGDGESVDNLNHIF